MENFDQFQSYNDSFSQYGPIQDDTSSVISGYTNGTRRTDLRSQLDTASAFDRLSITGDEVVSRPAQPHTNGGTNGFNGATSKGATDDEFESGLEDSKREKQVDLPPHACRYALVLRRLSHSILTHVLCHSVIVVYTLLPASSNASSVPSGFATLAETRQPLTSSITSSVPSTRKLSCTPIVLWAKPLRNATTAVARTSSCWDSSRRKAILSSCSYAGEFMRQ